MHCRSRHRDVFCRLAVLAAVLALVPLSALAGDRPPAVQVSLDIPATAVVGEEFTADVLIEGNGYEIYAIQFTLSFDNTKLAVLDDDGGTAGIQITAGDCPAPDFVVTNLADNSTGEVDYAATALNPTPPCTGGVVASIRFQAIGGGETQQDFTELLVADSDGYEIPHAHMSGFITIGAAPVDKASWSTIKAIYR